MMLRPFMLGLVVLAPLCAACGELDAGSDPSDDAALEADAPAEDESEITTNVGLVATADTYLRSANPTTPGGTSSLLTVRAGSSKGRALIKVDTAGLQGAVAGKELVRARLRVRVNSTGSYSGTRALAVHRMNRSWVENNATWVCSNDSSPSNTVNNCTTANSWTMTTSPLPYDGPAVGTFNVTVGTVGYHYVDVTADVAAIVAGTRPNDGWLIKVDNETTSATINLNSRSHATYKPRLILSLIHI